MQGRVSLQPRGHMTKVSVMGCETPPSDIMQDPCFTCSNRTGWGRCFCSCSFRDCLSLLHHSRVLDFESKLHLAEGKSNDISFVG
ncbi:hypothetical protein AVEN_164090-1 [Araneus ventricosus]|uniref:Uncharacterized protein n=1 Tax=Araneus ventricosus TaxID=182803 RepID=A0A4Y2RQH9_ARAVE